MAKKSYRNNEDEIQNKIVSISFNQKQKDELKESSLKEGRTVANLVKLALKNSGYISTI